MSRYIFTVIDRARSRLAPNHILHAWHLAIPRFGLEESKPRFPDSFQFAVTSFSYDRFSLALAFNQRGLGTYCIPKPKFTERSQLEHRKFLETLENALVFATESSFTVGGTTIVPCTLIFIHKTKKVERRTTGNTESTHSTIVCSARIATRAEFRLLGSGTELFSFNKQKSPVCKIVVYPIQKGLQFIETTDFQLYYLNGIASSGVAARVTTFRHEKQLRTEPRTSKTERSE